MSWQASHIHLRFVPRSSSVVSVLPLHPKGWVPADNKQTTQVYGFRPFLAFDTILLLLRKGWRTSQSESPYPDTECCFPFRENPLQANNKLPIYQ